jgi:DNA-directed RNA polymerase specialized sigma24 family protein
MDDFDLWYEQEYPRVLAACAALAGELESARDATGEAFARAFERWATVSAMAAPGGWVQTVALNGLRRSLRRRRLERALGSAWRGPAVGLPDPELWMVVRSLPARQQTAVVLAYVHDLPGAAIAEVMGVSLGTVSSTLDAARKSLRRRLTEPITSEENVSWLT